MAKIYLKKQEDTFKKTLKVKDTKFWIYFPAETTIAGRGRQMSLLVKVV